MCSSLCKKYSSNSILFNTDNFEKRGQERGALNSNSFYVLCLCSLFGALDRGIDYCAPNHGTTVF